MSFPSLNIHHVELQITGKTLNLPMDLDQRKMVTHLICTNNSFSLSKLYWDILCFMPNLTSFTLSRNFDLKQPSDFHTWIKLPKSIKEIKLCGSVVDFLNLLETEGHPYTQDEMKMEILKNFLLRSKHKPNVLKFSGISEARPTQWTSGAFSQLKHLEIINTPALLVGFEEKKFVKFTKSETLKLDGDFYKLLEIFEAPKLTTLDLRVYNSLSESSCRTTASAIVNFCVSTPNLQRFNLSRFSLTYLSQATPEFNFGTVRILDLSRSYSYEMDISELSKVNKATNAPHIFLNLLDIMILLPETPKREVNRVAPLLRWVISPLRANLAHAKLFCFDIITDYEKRSVTEFREWRMLNGVQCAEVQLSNVEAPLYRGLEKVEPVNN
ncbi:hypothetical protein BDQ17DRAFT_1429432 [Cyathus striatus]|nr:hypothetical protein BDQ17DRAFT_1429432 [Cyathus striatus]